MNIEARTVEAVIMTGKSRERSDFRGPYHERLLINKSAVDLSRLNGAPVLNNHNRRGHEDQVGVVQNPRIEAGKVVAQLRFFSGAQGDEIMQKISEGMRSVSAGYIAEEETESTDENGVRTVTINKSTPLEVSLVPIGLDEDAKIRSFEMSQTQQIDDARNEEAARIDGLKQASLPGYENELVAAIKDGTSPETFAAKIASLEKDKGAEYIKMRQRAEEDGAPPADRISSGESLANPAFRSRAMSAAIVQRAMPSFKAPAEAEAYRGWSFVDMARDDLERRGVYTRGMRPDQIIRTAMGQSRNFQTRAAGSAYGAQGSGDFVGTVGQAAQMFLLERYRIAPPVLKTVASEMTFTDYRPHKSIRGSAFPQLKEVKEHGEITHGQLSDVGEDITLIRYGRIVGLTHQALVNDEVGQFRDLINNAAETSLAQESALLAAKVEENPVMADGDAVFHANHNNLAGTGAAPDETTLSARRSAMRKQLGLNSERIAPTPKYFVVPTDLETTAEKLVSTIQATKTADANVFTNLQVLVEPRFADAAAWYLAADPAEVQSLRYGYLDSEGGPVVDERPGWEIDGIEIRVRLSFGAGFVDFRGWQKNPGA